MVRIPNGKPTSKLDESYADSYRSGTPNAEDCSGFVITAALKIGVRLPATHADGLLIHMKANWESLGTGATGLSAARKAAANGNFVVVGASAADLKDTNGHVAVLLESERGGWPLVYGGAINSAARTQGDKTLNYVFRRADHPKLQYYAAHSATSSTPSVQSLGTARLKDLKSGISNPTYMRLTPPLRLCRFTDRRYGSLNGVVSPWWIVESDFLKIIAARERSRAVHGGDKARALSLGFLARWAVAVPQEWQRDGGFKPTTMDLLLRADLRQPLDAFTGRARVQREISPNGIDITWSGWTEVTQFYFPALSRLAPSCATVRDALQLLSVGAPTYIKSSQLYGR